MTISSTFTILVALALQRQCSALSSLAEDTQSALSKKRLNIQGLLTSLGRLVVVARRDAGEYGARSPIKLAAIDRPRGPENKDIQ
ncbi:hypothetical protein EON65_30445 [archaeon]|nr:MAG: hypothetical protein EON65_30445 [archaeon]